MATLKPHIFSSYFLTADEITSGTILTQLQKFVIQNQISILAEQKLNLVFDPLNPADFGIQTSFLAGKIESLLFLLADSDDAEKAIASIA